MKRKIFFLSLITIFFVSCKESVLYDDFYRNFSDPFEDVPEVSFMEKEGVISVLWQEDECADNYFLMRSEDAKSDYLLFECVYSGKNTFFLEEAKEGSRYIYRLDKIRGDKRFLGKEYKVGFASPFRNDSYEPNNTEESATELNHDMVCSLTCVRYDFEEIVSVDEDWFYVRLLPQRTAEIILSQTGLENASFGTTTDLFFMEAGKEKVPVMQKKGIKITNSSFETKKILFCITSPKEKIMDEKNGYGRLEYSISLSVIYKYEL